ncbi:MAG: response regulator transcription factor [Dehalococcoidales bacterium]|nr:response regulator transcription factor [Dehalococcoidales bacterium]
MFRIFFIAETGTGVARIQAGLVRCGLACTTVTNVADALERLAEEAPHLILIEITYPERLREVVAEIKQVRQVPVIALVPREMLPRLDASPETDDFVIKSDDPAELVLRIKRLADKAQRASAGELIMVRDLVIDTARCEVTVGGRLTGLTFREYELVKFLASHPGQVFSREALLDKVWGYDFFGGDRTVDVHVRRLRSKIEDATHDFIETVRNIGYRFKES